MTEAVVSGKDTRCLFINNGDDLLTLKKVVSKKSDKDDNEKQKNKNSNEMNGSELNGNHNKTDSINFDVDNTSSLEPNLEMDSDTDRNITIDSICTQEDQESENIDVSNENSNEADMKSGEKDVQVISIKCSDKPYTPTDSLGDNEYSHDLGEIDLELSSPKSPTTYFNISSRAPLHSNNELDSILEDDILKLEEKVAVDEKKRKLEDLLGNESKSNKVLKLWDIMKYPFQNKSIGTSKNENETIKLKSEIVTEEEKFIIPEETVCENNSDNLKSNEINNSSNIESDKNASEITTNKQKFCSLM